MKINRRFLIIESVVLIGAVLLAINVQVAQRERQKPPLRWAEFAASRVSVRLKAFYAAFSDVTSSTVNDKFTLYIVNKPRFSLEPMQGPSRFKGDCGFYLMLPSKLQSNRRRLMAYTNPRPDKNGNPARIGIFLTRQTIEMSRMTELQLGKFTGSKKNRPTEPAFYFTMNKN